MQMVAVVVVETLFSMESTEVQEAAVRAQVLRVMEEAQERGKEMLVVIIPLVTLTHMAQAAAVVRVP